MAKILANRDGGQSVWLLVENINRMFEGEVVKVLEPLDLSIELLKIIYLIDDCDGGTVGDLQSASTIEPDRVAAGVRALQMRGLVTRPKPKADAETTVVRFTTEGRMTARRAHIAIERLQERAGGWLGVHQEPLMVALRRLVLLPPLPGDAVNR